MVLRDSSGRRIPTPTGDPTGAGYAKQYSAYEAAGGVTAGMAEPTYKTEKEVSAEKQAASGLVSPSEIQRDVYKVSGREVTQAVYEAQKALARGRAMRGGGYDIEGGAYTEVFGDVRKDISKGLVIVPGLKKKVDTPKQPYTYKGKGYPTKESMMIDIKRDARKKITGEEAFFVGGVPVTRKEFDILRGKEIEKATGWQQQKVFTKPEVITVEPVVKKGLVEKYSDWAKETLYKEDLPARGKETRLVTESRKFISELRRAPYYTSMLPIWAGKAKKKGLELQKKIVEDKEYRKRVLEAAKYATAQTFSKEGLKGVWGSMKAPGMIGTTIAGLVMFKGLKTGVKVAQKPVTIKKTPLSSESFIKQKPPTSKGIIPVKIQSKLRYKEQVYFGAEPFGKPYYYVTKRTVDVKGKPVLFKEGFTAQVVYGEKGVRGVQFEPKAPAAGEVIRRGVVQKPVETKPVFIPMSAERAARVMKATKPIEVTTQPAKGFYIGGKAIQTLPSTVEKLEPMLYKFTFKGKTAPSPIPTTEVTAKGYGLIIPSPARGAPALRIFRKEGLIKLKKKAKTFYGIGLATKVIVKGKVPVKVRPWYERIGIGVKPKVATEFKTFERIVKGAGVQEQSPFLGVSKKGLRGLFEVAGVSKALTLRAGEPSATIVRGFIRTLKKPPKVVSWGADPGKMVTAPKGEGFGLGGISPFEKKPTGEFIPSRFEGLAAKRKPQVFQLDQQYRFPESVETFEAAGRAAGIDIAGAYRVTAPTRVTQPSVLVAPMKLDLKQEVATTQVIRQRQVITQTSKQLQESKQVMKQLQKQMQKQTQVSSRAQVQQQIQVQQQVQKQLQQQIQQQKQVQKQVQQQLQKQVTTAQFISPYISTPTIIPRVTVPITRFSVLKGALEKVARVPAYQLLIRRAGAFKPVGKPLPKWLAAEKGQKIVGKTLAATFRLEPKGMVAGVPRPVRIGREFRPYQIVKGRQVPTPLQWIEKRPFRLKARAEVSEIQFFKARKGKKVKGGFLR